MATVADIEPASLDVTPGQAEVFSLSVRNEGDDVEAYHLSAVDEAAELVVIEPDTLLVRPGETGTATATIKLEHTGRWSVGELIVRFHIVPTEQPDDFLVVEAIATIQSFSDVAAVLSPPTVEGRRRAEAEIAIANAGNAHAYADVAVSAGELAVSIDQAHAALPANSTASIDLRVRANGILWRGDPVQHPFVVTVTPEDHSSISLEGTFTQLPLLPGWTFRALIGVGAAIALLLVLWLGAALLGGLGGGATTDSVAGTQTKTPTPTPTPKPTPSSVGVTLSPPAAAPPAGDPFTTVMEVSVADPPEDALVAVAVSWAPALALVGHDCRAWIDPNTESEPAVPVSGDECLVDSSADPGGAQLTFTTPPAGLATESNASVEAKPTRFVTVDAGGDIETLANHVDSKSAELLVTAAAYPFWMQLEVLSPSASDDGTRWGVVWVHRTLAGNDATTTMAFELVPPPTVEAELMVADDILDDRPIAPNEDETTLGCDQGSSGNRCNLRFVIDEDGFGKLQQWTVPVGLTSTGNRADGLIMVRGAPDAQVHEDQVLPAAAPLVVGDGAFPVNIELIRDGDQVEATLNLTQATFPGEAESSKSGSRMVTGSRMLSVTVSWPEALELSPSEAPKYCQLSATGKRELVCPFNTPSEASDLPGIKLSFSILDEEAPQVSIGAQGEMLTFPPEGDAAFDAPSHSPFRWIASDVKTLEFE